MAESTTGPIQNEQSIVITLIDCNTPTGVRMVLKDNTITFPDFVKQACLRLESTQKPVIVRCFEHKILITHTQDIIHQDKIEFIYDTVETFGNPMKEDATTTEEPRSVTFECFRLTLTFILFICLHQGFLYWFNGDLQNDRLENNRVQEKIQSLKYPSGMGEL